MRKTKLILLLLAALLLGVCLGFFGNTAIIRARIRHFSRIPGNVPEHIVQKLTARLDLNAAQQEQIRAVVQAHGIRLQEAREQSRATFTGLLADMRAEIATHLTPEQQTKHAQLIAEIDAMHRNNRDLMRAMRKPPRPAGLRPVSRQVALDFPRGVA